MRRSLLLASLMLLACSHRAKGPDGQPLWFEVQTDNFVLRAATDEPTAREAARKLERVRQALREGAWHAKTEPPGKVQVVLLEDDAALARYLPKNIGGLTTQDSLGQLFIVASAGQDIAEIPVLKHELVHAISHQFLIRSPLWFTEGLAVYLETLKLTEEGAILGVAEPAAVSFVRSTPLDFGMLLLDGPDVYSRGHQVVARFYARAWLVVHLLVNNHRDQLDAFIARLARAEDPQAAFAASFPGLSPEALEREAVAHLKKGEYYSTRIALPRLRIEMQVRTLRPAEVRATQAQFIRTASLPGQPSLRDKAELEARAARELDPGEPLAALALCDATPDDGAACAEAARAASKAHPGDYRGFLLLSRALQIQRGPEWEAATERAAQLAPEDPLALVGASNLRLSQNRFDEALDAARKANHNAPGRPMPLDMLATVLAASGRCDDAVRIEKRVFEVLPDAAPPGAVAKVNARIVELGRRCAEDNRVRANNKRIEEENKRASAKVTPPRKLGCDGRGPRIPPLRSLKKGATVAIHYKVLADGTVADASSSSEVPRRLIDAVLAFARSCKFDPAQRNGEPLEVEMDEVFTLQRQR